MFFALHGEKQHLYYFEHEKKTKPKGLIDLSYGAVYPVHESYFGRWVLALFWIWNRIYTVMRLYFDLELLNWVFITSVSKRFLRREVTWFFFIDFSHTALKILFKRSRLIVWNVMLRVYNLYTLPTHWFILSMFPLSLHSFYLSYLQTTLFSNRNSCFERSFFLLFLRWICRASSGTFSLLMFLSFSHLQDISLKMVLNTWLLLGLDEGSSGELCQTEPPTSAQAKQRVPGECSNFLKWAFLCMCYYPTNWNKKAAVLLCLLF